MKKLNSKITVVLGLVLIVAVLVIYFAPAQLSRELEKDSTVIFSHIKMTVQDAQPVMDSTDYNSVSAQQMEELFQLFDNYSYRRSFATLFSDGSMSGNEGDGYLYMFIYDGTNLKNTVTFAYDDEISSNGKNYTLTNSDELIEGVVEILNR